MVRRQNLRKLVRNEIQAQEAKTTEVKHKQISYGINPSTTPYGYNMYEYLTLGDSASARVGNRINVLSQSMRVNIEAEQPYNNVRVMLVETRQPLPYNSVLGLYDGASVLQSTTLGVNSALDFDLVKKVYMDRTYQIAQLANGANPVKYLKKYIKHGKNGKRIFYDGNTTGLNSGNIRTHMYLLFMSDSSVIPHPRVAGGHYFRFTDK